MCLRGASLESVEYLAFHPVRYSWPIILDRAKVVLLATFFDTFYFHIDVQWFSRVRVFYSVAHDVREDIQDEFVRHDKT